MAKSKTEVKKQVIPKVGLPEGVIQDEDQENTVEQSQTGKKRHPGPWLKLTEKQVEAHSAAGTLVGYDPKTGEGIIKEA